MSNKRPVTTTYRPSDFENCLKLDIVGGGQAHLENVDKALRLGHPDVLHRPFASQHSNTFCFQTVYCASSSPHRWLLSRRYVCQSYQKLHEALFRKDIPLRWKNLYEVIPRGRPRHLYFDLEQKRPCDLSRACHDDLCWEHVLTLQKVVRETFRMTFSHIQDTDVVFYATRGYQQASVQPSRQYQTCQAKFSVHLVVKHSTHMFADEKDLGQFLSLLTKHELWSEVEAIVDMSVYAPNQTFRCAGATKAPDLDNANSNLNVLLPVDPVCGQPEAGIVSTPMLSFSSPYLRIHLHTWRDHLVTTFWEGEQAKKFTVIPVLCAIPNIEPQPRVPEPDTRSVSTAAVENKNILNTTSDNTGFRVAATASGRLSRNLNYTNSEPSHHIYYRDLGRACALATWRQFYGLDQRIKRHYVEEGVQRTPVSFLRQVAHFWVDPLTRRICIHFKRASLIYRCCVAKQPVQRVAERGGFHMSDGHTAVLSFSAERCCYVSCFDHECRHQHPLPGRRVFQLTDELYLFGCKVFERRP